MEKRNPELSAQESADASASELTDDRALFMVLNSNLNFEETRMVVKGKSIGWLTSW